MIIHLSVEDALASAEKMTTEAFITQTQRMAFHVRVIRMIHDLDLRFLEAFTAGQ